MAYAYMDFYFENILLGSVRDVPIPRVGEFVRINTNIGYRVEKVYYHYDSGSTISRCSVSVILSEAEE